MMATPSIAANAYASLAKLTDPSALTKGAGAGAGEVSGGPSFGALVKDALSSLSKTTHASDIQTQAAANGKANMVDVVTAVAESEVAIETLVSVRDKVISAYEEIMKMPI
jgi:flagellar hook-basal body complex protein FliE